MNASAHRPLLVFADDWGRHPSSCQHLVRQLLAARNVIWINTIGTRPPRFDWGTVKRVAGKLKSWTRSLPQVETHEPAPTTISPKMWPSFRSRFGRSLNQKLLLRSLRPIIDALPEPPDVVTTLPIVADLVGELKVNRWVYYCVDDFSVWPGYDGETLGRLERELVPKVDTIVAVSETLQNHIRNLGKESHLLTHGVDIEHWQKYYNSKVISYNNFDYLFWGVIDRRMDFDFVQALAPNKVLLVGPQEDPDPRLLKLPHVEVRPPMAFAELPRLAQSARVLIMPYIDAPVTRAMQPLKLKEYLATGKPVVVRELPSTLPWKDACRVCSSAEEFAAACRDDVTDSQKLARERLTLESWSAKAKKFEAWISGDIEAKQSRCSV